ncbi:hypothetical protein [Methylogaea oryzae]|uniref:hypothetical protein n=1 Tax=Methylogaea oryzae TaxID=1295382 RepID=UPI0006CFA334|nr:hypothetical protein [Methylogaea oryzae]
MQQHAMGKDNGPLQRWLEQSGLAAAPRLAECLEVRPGWETAVEKVLDRHLQAVCVDDFGGAVSHLEQLQGQSLALVATAAPAQSAAARSASSLAEQVTSPWALEGLLGSVYCAPDLAAAEAWRKNSPATSR